MLGAFPTETLVVYKGNKSKIEISALVDRNEIHTENVEVVIEEGDIFERTLPNGAKEYYKVIDRGYFKGNRLIPDNYQCKVERVDKSLAERMINKQTVSEKPRKLFISHSSKDADFVKAIVDLFEALGLHEDEIICSSVPPYCIPLDNDVYDWLVKEFQQSDLHIIYALSDYYYSSPASLNEMGAAWALKQKWTGILMPGFSFEKISGCIDSNQISIKLDDVDRRMLNYRLDELKNNLVDEFGLRPMSFTVWERKRDEFLDKINDLMLKRANNTKKEENGQQYQPVVGENDVGSIPVEVAFLLVYAAAEDGQITRIQTLNTPPQISASGRQFMANNSQRESARWQEALDILVKWGWTRPVGRKGNVFELTETGYEKADMLKEGMCIDTDIEPLEELKNFI